MDRETALESPICMKEVNQQIEIYSGEFTLELENLKITLEGNICIKWLPEVNIMYSGKVIKGSDLFQGSSLMTNARKIKVKLVTPTGYTSLVMINKIIHEHEYIIAGVVLGSFERLGMEMDRLCFSVVNFEDSFGKAITREKKIYLGRMNFEHGDYQITFDKLPNHSDNYKGLNETGGYMITHTGVIKNSKNESFNIHEVEYLLDNLSWLLSFACGRQVGICALLGFNNKNDLVFEKYQTPIISKWKNIQNWYPKIKDNVLENIFQNLVLKMTDDLWGTVLKRVFTWYFDSFNSTYIDNNIVAVQIALEMLAWTFIVEENEIIDSKIFDNKLRASDKLRLLLYELSIPRELPDIQDFNMLKSSYKDGPHLFTDFRNDIVHSKRLDQNDNKIPPVTKLYILQLGRQYLELSILKILGYRGEYHNYLSEKEWLAETIENVPWYSM